MNITIKPWMTHALCLIGLVGCIAGTTTVDAGEHEEAAHEEKLVQPSLDEQLANAKQDESEPPQQVFQVEDRRPHKEEPSETLTLASAAPTPPEPTEGMAAAEEGVNPYQPKNVGGAGSVGTGREGQALLNPTTSSYDPDADLEKLTTRHKELDQLIKSEGLALKNLKEELKQLKESKIEHWLDLYRRENRVTTKLGERLARERQAVRHTSDTIVDWAKKTLPKNFN